MKTSETRESTKRMAAALTPAILAVGQAMSTDTGRMLFAMAYDADRSLDWERRRFATNYEGKRPSKASQETKYYEGLNYGKRIAFVRALASLACQMGGNSSAASVYRCQCWINREIDILRNRTEEEEKATSLMNIYSKAIDF